MLSLLGDYQGSLEVNGIVYNSLNEAVQALNDRPGPLTISKEKDFKFLENCLKDFNLKID